ncbi:YcnI family protein [Arenibacterium halophilum]|uniref:YcnI family protein n=1 Tax=Arenibacterium halophilum TaxID=2583821 RepID=A0ABY2X687_9RHOB|nr:YcnI family protein [Arenibacterium halophilum]
MRCVRARILLETHTVHITLPEGFYAAKPMPRAGWKLTTKTGVYATRYNNHGTEMTEGLREVTWSGGDLPDAWYDEFTVRGTFGPDVAPGTVLYFPALQTCAHGMADWTDTGGSHDVPNPAPKVTVVAGGKGHGYGHGAKADHAMDAVTVGEVEVPLIIGRMNAKCHVHGSMDHGSHDMKN